MEHDYNITTHFSRCVGTPPLMTMSSLFALLSDIAVEDFTKKVSYDTLCHEGFVLPVNRASVVIRRLPNMGEHIVVSTEVHKSERFQFVRSFLIKSSDSSEEPLVRALTTWLLVDIKSRKLLPIEAFYSRFPDAKNESERDPLSLVGIGVCDKLKVPENSNRLLLGTHLVTKRDLDPNGHMNNSAFIAAVGDFVDMAGLTNFSINYIHEAKFDETLTFYKTSGEGGVTLLSGFVGERASVTMSLSSGA